MMRRVATALIVLWSVAIAAPSTRGVEIGGHVKAQALLRRFDPGDVRAAAGEQADLQSLLSRCNVAGARGSWDLSVQTQLQVLRGDGLPVVDDARQALDLGWTISDGAEHLVLGRLDRLSVGVTRGPLAIRCGRQASSWGGGLVFQVLDLFDPFPPDAVDTEYKPGVDMLTAQWLFPGGDDLQAIVVPRRAEHDRPLAASQSSAALEWRHFASSVPLEVLAARHYRDTVLGVGASGDVGGGVWRLDVATTVLDGGTVVASGLLNLDRTWTWMDRNVEGYIEYFRNGFGVASTDRDIEDLPSALVARLDRAELFNVGRDEIAVGGRWEWTPLTSIEPTALLDLDDGSAYLLLQARHELRQDLDLATGAQVPVGGRGTEYGGMRSAALGGTVAPGRTAWVRVSRYF